MIAGLGIDIIEIDRIADAVSRLRFRERVFTPAEQNYCNMSSGAERYAGRFAAKEAIIKALGQATRWLEIEILPGSKGNPEVELYGEAAKLLGNNRLVISISHSRHYAVAQAVIETPDTP